MKKKALVAGILATSMVLTACGGGAKLTQEDLENAYTGYDDLISIVVNGMSEKWQGVDPQEYNLSPVYTMGDPMTLGFAKVDLNGDGVDELVMGEDMGDEDVIYDIKTVVKEGKEAKVVTVFSGGERNRMYIDSNGLLVNEGSNGADDSFVKYYKLEKGALTEVKDAKEAPYTNIDYDHFGNYVTVEEPSVGMANPWMEMSDAQALEAACGIPFALPEGATDAHYYYNETLKMGQVTFGWDGVSYTARMCPTSGPEDISGVYITFDNENSLMVGGVEGTDKRGSSEGTYYDVASWYDVAPGIQYCVVAVSDHDFDGFDITAVCEQFFVRAQGDVG